jgi:glycerol-3-phosphate dehydrogenase
VLAAEVVHAVEHEMAMRLDDVVFRRTELHLAPRVTGALLCRCAEVMGAALGWDESTRASAVAESRQSMTRLWRRQ